MSSDLQQGFTQLECQQFCLRVADGTHDTPLQSEIGKRLATSKNIKEGRLTLENAYLISMSDFNEINRRSKVDQWDILISMIGTVGEVCLIDTPEPDFAIKNVGLLKCGNELKARWLYYYLRSSGAQALIHARKKGTTQQYISLGEIRRLPVSVPQDQAYMELAVESLSALDRRIDLLRETNATLEAIAQALFKSWFVDFDPVRAKQQGLAPEGMDEATAALFPDGFEESELGSVPKGWRVSNLDKVSDVGIGKTPPRKESHWFSENPGDVRWVSIRDMGSAGTFLSRTSEYLTAEAIDRFNVRRVPDSTVLLSFKLTIGRVSITDGEMTTNEAIAHCKLTKHSPVPSEYIYLHLKQFDYATLSSTSSIADAVNSKTVKAIPILVPSPDVVAVFSATVSVLFERIKSLQTQAQTLTNLRDTLLPRLISGQLSLPDDTLVEHDAILEETA